MDSKVLVLSTVKRLPRSRLVGSLPVTPRAPAGKAIAEGSWLLKRIFSAHVCDEIPSASGQLQGDVCPLVTLRESRECKYNCHTAASGPPTTHRCEHEVFASRGSEGPRRGRAPMPRTSYSADGEDATPLRLSQSFQSLAVLSAVSTPSAPQQLLRYRTAAKSWVLEQDQSV